MLRKLIVMILIVILAIIPVISATQRMQIPEFVEVSDLTKQNHISYVDHPKFSIIGNDDFSTYFTGSGTPEQPYTFEGQNITSSGILISITNTDAYCVINDCFFRTVAGEILWADALVLDNASHVTIKDCTFYNVSTVVSATDSNNLTIAGCFSDEIVASDIILTNCPQSNITGNRIEGSYWSGNPLVKLTQCNTSLIHHNNVTWTLFQIINSNETQITHNALSESKIYAYASQDVLAEYNILDCNNYADGIELMNCFQSNITHNIVMNQLVDGITVSGSSEILVRNNSVTNPGFGSLNNDYGILIDDSIDCIIENNTVSKNEFAGIAISYSNNTLVYDNIAYNNYYGFYDRGTLDSKFNNCLAWYNSKQGYYTWESNRMYLEYCNSTLNQQEGFQIGSCYDCQLYTCYAELNEFEGFLVGHSNNTLLWNCKALNNGQTPGHEGFEITYSDYTQIWWSSAKDNSGRNFYFFESDYCRISKSGISNSLATSVMLESCSFCELDNSEFYAAGSVYLRYVTNVTVSDSSFRFNKNYAIQVDTSTNVSLLRNTIDDNYIDEANYEGIYVEDSSNVRMIDNQISNMDDAAIYLDQSSYCYLDNNTLDFGGLYIEGSQRECWSHEVTSDNLVLGKSIHYLVNESFAYFDMTTAGQVFLVDSENVSIADGIFAKTSVGCMMVFCKNCSVSSISTDYCHTGLYSYYSEDCRVGSSQFYHGGYTGSAIYGEFSAGLNVSGCYAEQFGDAFHVKESPGSIFILNEMMNVTGYGIWVVDSPDSFLLNNTLWLCDEGFVISWSDKTEVEGNVLISDIDYGIFISSSQGCLIIDNEISVSKVGIQMSGIGSGRIESNTIHGDQSCLSFFSTQDLEIYSNTFSSTGILLHTDSMVYYNHTLIDNTVGGLPIGFFENEAGIEIDASDYGQILLIYCENTTVQGHEMAKVSVPLYLVSCYNITVANYSLTDVYWGLKSYNSTHCSIQNHTVVGSTNAGVYLTQSHNTSLAYVNSSFSDYYGLYLYYSQDCTLVHSEIWNSTQVGLHAEHADYLQVEDLSIINCTGQGLYLYYSDNVVTNDTLVIDCMHGLYLYGADNCNVTNSGFFNNTNGVWIRSGSNNLFYLNEFGGNSGNNALDDVAGNFWDDDIINGNSWSDYYGGGIYEVPGTGGGIDGFPSGLQGYTIIINGPDNQTFNEGTTGKSIVWTSSSSYIRFYQVYLNSTFQYGGVWRGGPIVVSLNGLSNGTYYYTLKLTSFFGSSNFDVVEIIVIPITTPTTDHPDNIWYWVGDEGNTLTWNASSSDPDYLESYLNGTHYGPFAWDGNAIVANLDGYDVGVYNITVVFYSRCGNSVSDTVFMTVRARSIPQVSSPDDFWYWFGSEDNSVAWEASCAYPDRYEFYINGTLEASGDWDGANMEFEVDDFSVGVHYLTIFFYSLSNNQTHDTVLLTVNATSTPLINQPADLLFEEGAVGESIVWIVSDLYPFRYEILIDGVLNRTGEWDGEDIIFSLDDFAAGEYNITLIVYSESGPSSSDSVMVVVTEASTSTTTTTTTPTTTESSSTTTDTSTGTTGTTTSSTPPLTELPPMMLILGIGGAAACGIVVLLLVLVKRKK